MTCRKVSNARRAFSLMELLISMAVALVILGVVFAILINVQAGSDRVVTREQIAQELLVIDTKLGTFLSQTIPDERLSDEGLPASRYEQKEMEFYIANEGLKRCLIKVVEEEGARNTARIVVSMAPVIEGKVGDFSASIPLGVGRDKYKSTIYFSYTSDYDGLAPKWQSSTDETPRVVRYAISVMHPNRPELTQIATSARRLPNL